MIFCLIYDKETGVIKYSSDEIEKIRSIYQSDPSILVEEKAYYSILEKGIEFVIDTDYIKQNKKEIYSTPSVFKEISSLWNLTSLSHIKKDKLKRMNRMYLLHINGGDDFFLNWVYKKALFKYLLSRQSLKIYEEVQDYGYVNDFIKKEMEDIYEKSFKSR